jgi:hypothetical protein
MDDLNAFLRQGMREKADFQDCLRGLEALAARKAETSKAVTPIVEPRRA